MPTQLPMLEVARQLNVPVRTLAYWIRIGKIQAFKAGGIVLVDMKEADQVLARDGYFRKREMSKKRREHVAAK